MSFGMLSLVRLVSN